MAETVEFELYVHDVLNPRVGGMARFTSTYDGEVVGRHELTFDQYHKVLGAIMRAIDDVKTGAL